MKKFKISKFFKKKKSSIKNFNSMKKFKISKIFKKKKRRRRKFSKKALGLGAFGSYFLGCFKKKKKKSSIKIFNSFKKIQDFQIFSKKKIKIFNSFEKFKFSKLKKKKKKSSLNSFSRTESYDPLPHSPMMQHQVNYPPSAFIEVWSMS